MENARQLFADIVDKVSFGRVNLPRKGSGGKGIHRYPGYDRNGIHRVYNNGTRLEPDESQGIALRTINRYINDPHEGISTEALSSEVAGMRDTLATVPDHAIRLRLARLYKQQRDDHNHNVLRATQKKKDGLALMAHLQKHPFGNLLEEHSMAARLWDGFRRYWRALIIGHPRAASQRFYMNHKSLIIENPGFTRDEVVIPIDQIGSNYAVGPDAPVWMTGINRFLVRFGLKQRYPFGLGVINVTETGSKTDVGSIEINDPQAVIKEINRIAGMVKAAKADLPIAKSPITMSDLLVDPHALIPVTPDLHPRHRKDQLNENSHDALVREQLAKITENLSQMVSDSMTLPGDTGGNQATDLVREHMEQIIAKIPEMISESVSRSVARTLQEVGVTPKIEDSSTSPNIVDAGDQDYAWDDSAGDQDS